MEELQVRFSPFPHPNSSEHNSVNLDHSYAKPWNTHPNASNAQPLRMLFMDKFPRPENQEKESGDEDIDVEGEAPVPMLPYDAMKARSQMVECEKHLALLCPDHAPLRDDWEESIAAMRTSWSTLQNRIFAKVIRVLQNDRLAKLSIKEVKNEAILRRLQVDKAARRVRHIFANIQWDMPLILWLHNLFLHSLKGQLFVSYLEVLQTLRAKVPSLVEKLVTGTDPRDKSLSPETLNTLLKKPWDPVISSVSQQKMKHLPESPVLLIIPSAATSSSHHQVSPLSPKRHNFWKQQLAALGKVYTISTVNNHNITIASCVESIITAVRSKIAEVRSNFPARPIVLVGWHVGAVVACHVGLLELLQAVVCLGLPTMGTHGNIWDIEDNLYGCQTPTLFLVGQQATCTSLDMLEEVRGHLHVETSVLLVGGADHMLRVSRAKKKAARVTQAMVDRCLMDEISDFLGGILSKLHLGGPDDPGKPSALVRDMADDAFKMPRKRKQKELGPYKPSLKVSKTLGLPRGVFPGQVTVNAAGKIVKKKSPKKYKMYKKNGLLTKKGKLVLANSQPSSPITTATDLSEKPAEEILQDKEEDISVDHEAAAISAAPELSNLLQSIKSDSHTDSAPSDSEGPPGSPLTIDLTTPSSISSGLAGLLSRAGVLRLNPDDLPSYITEGTQFSSSERHIQLRAGPDSEPISVPLSMACQAFKPSATHGSQLSQRLGSSKVMTPATPTLAPHMADISTHSSLSAARGLVSASSSSSLSQTLMSPDLIGQSPARQVYDARMSPEPSSPIMFNSPGASIINMGSDSMFMKESPPATSPAPGTVSIDLGQIGNPANMLKINSSPRVSLIPSSKLLQGLSGAPLETVLHLDKEGQERSTPTIHHIGPSAAGHSQSQVFKGLHHVKPTTSMTQTDRSLPGHTVYLQTSGLSMSQTLRSLQAPLRNVTRTPLSTTTVRQSHQPFSAASPTPVRHQPSLSAATTVVRPPHTPPVLESGRSFATMYHKIPSTSTPPTPQHLTSNNPGMVTLQLASSGKDSSTTVVTFSKDGAEPKTKQQIFHHQQVYQLPGGGSHVTERVPDGTAHRGTKVRHLSSEDGAPVTSYATSLPPQLKSESKTKIAYSFTPISKSTYIDLTSLSATANGSTSTVKMFNDASTSVVKSNKDSTVIKIGSDLSANTKSSYATQTHKTHSESKVISIDSLDGKISQLNYQPLNKFNHPNKKELIGAGPGSNNDSRINFSPASPLAKKSFSPTKSSYSLLSPPGKPALSGSLLYSESKSTVTGHPDPLSLASAAQGNTTVVQYKTPGTLIGAQGSRAGPTARPAKMVVSASSETLGQVTSLLESSPVTMGDPHRRPPPVTSVQHKRPPPPYTQQPPTDTLAKRARCATPATARDASGGTVGQAVADRERGNQTLVRQGSISRGGAQDSGTLPPLGLSHLGPPTLTTPGTSCVTGQGSSNITSQANITLNKERTTLGSSSEGLDNQNRILPEVCSTVTTPSASVSLGNDGKTIKASPPPTKPIQVPSPRSMSLDSTTPGTPVPGTPIPGTPVPTRACKSSSSYAATTKPVTPTVASTRTRRIKTPKQYDSYI